MIYVEFKDMAEEPFYNSYVTGTPLFYKDNYIK